MQIIFVLSLISLIALWVFGFIGMMSPKLLLIRQKDKVRSRADILIGCSLGSFILYIILNVTSPNPNNDKVGTHSKNYINNIERKVEGNKNSENFNNKYTQYF